MPQVRIDFEPRVVPSRATVARQRLSSYSGLQQFRPATCSRRTTLGGSRMLQDLAACHDRLNLARILGSPLAKRSQRLSQGSSERREGIFDLRGYLSEIDTIDDPVRLQFLELLNQHFIADCADGP